MAIIVQISEREASRYSRRFGETLEKEAEIVLFTGVQYEREEDELYQDPHAASDNLSNKALLALIDCAEDEKSAG